MKGYLSGVVSFIFIILGLAFCISSLMLLGSFVWWCFININNPQTLADMAGKGIIASVVVMSVLSLLIRDK